MSERGKLLKAAKAIIKNAKIVQDNIDVLPSGDRDWLDKKIANYIEKCLPKKIPLPNNDDLPF